MCREAKGEIVRHAWVLRKEGTGKAAECWAGEEGSWGRCLWGLKQRKEKVEHWRVRAYPVFKEG